MAIRWPFGGGTSEWTLAALADLSVQAAAGVTVTAWSSRTGGTQYTDLAEDAAGASPLTDVTSEDGTSGTAVGQIPPFYGPPGIKGMWLSGNGGPRSWVETTAAADYAAGVGLAAPALKPIVPLYEYPSFFGSGWDDLGANGYGMVIANPSSGPGAGNSDYTREIDSARAAGMKVLGYVTTDSSGLGGATAGSRATSAIRTDIDDWYTLYNVDGIFFDLTPTGVTAVLGTYVDEICGYVHSKAAGALAVINPGTYPLDATYIDAADVACVYEGDFTANSYGTFTVPGYATYVGQYPATKYLHLVYGLADFSELITAAAHAVELGVGYFFGATTNSAWLTLPAFWDDEVDALRHSHPQIDPLNRGNHYGTLQSHQIAWNSQRRGRVTLNGTSTITVNTKAVTTASDILLTIQVPGGTTGSPKVVTRTAGTSFGVASQAGDTSTVAWFLF